MTQRDIGVYGAADLQPIEHSRLYDPRELACLSLAANSAGDCRRRAMAVTKSTQSGDVLSKTGRIRAPALKAMRSTGRKFKLSQHSRSKFLGLSYKRSGLIAPTGSL